MSSLIVRGATIVAIATFTACASAPKDTARYHSPSDPCFGAGELFFAGLPEYNPMTFPTNATARTIPSNRR